VSAGYRHRQVRPLYPEIPASICDCALLPDEHCCQREDLVHAQELASERCDAPVDEGRRHVSYTRVHLRCPNCGQFWWLHSQDRTDHTYARDDETTIVGSVSYSVSHAVRCVDERELAMLDAWLPRYFDALAQRDRLFAEAAGRATPGARAAIVSCIDLAASSAATRMLGETTARARKLADTVRRDLHDRLTRTIAALEAQPDDAEAWKTLERCQQRCAAARLDDSAREMTDWTMEEWWTPALAGVGRLEFEIHALRNAARGKAVGSPEHAALRASEDEIAARWNRHLERVAWPHPEVAFVALLAHAQSLAPMVVARDMASWAQPDRIGRALRGLLDSGQVTPTRHMDVVPWLAARTGLPDAHARHEARAAANYWLPIRRARREAERRERGG